MTESHSQRRRQASTRARARALLTAASLGALCVGAGLGVGADVAGVAQAARPSARAHAATALNENGRLHLTSKHGFTLNEQGSASGTIRGTIYVHLTIASTSRVTAEVSIYPAGGSITGYASASYHKGSSTADFSGTIAITRGSGRYAHTRGSGVGFSGTIQKSNDAVTVRLDGTVSG